MALIFTAAFVFSQETMDEDERILEERLDERKSPHRFSIFTDFAYYPYSDMVAGNGERFAPITGPYDSLQFGVTASYDYTIPLPGSNFLTKGNKLKLGAECQISPATFKPRIFASWTPVAFFVVNAGLTAGTGWPFLGAQGLATYNASSGEYDNLTPFANWYGEFSIGGTLQFDAEAVWPGDWHHIVFMASYDFRLSGLTGQEKGHPWCWASDYAKVNGPWYYANVILGYQMPLKLSMVGFQAEFTGYFSDSQFDSKYRAFDGNFCNMTLSPLFMVSFTKKDMLLVLFTFERRRGFDSKKGTYNGRDQNVLEMRSSGGEWYFKRIAFRYIHNF